MMSLVSLRAALLDLVEEVAMQLVRRGQPRHDVGRDRDEVERQPPEQVKVLARKPEQFGDDPGGELERQRLHQVGVPVVLDLVDQLIADRTDDRWLPAFERGGTKCLGYQASMVVMLLAAHRQDHVAHHQPDRLVVVGGGEDLVVAERLEDAVVAEQHPLVFRFQLWRHQFVVHQRPVEHRIGAAHVFEVRIGAGLAGGVQSDGLVPNIRAFGAQRHCRSFGVPGISLS